MEPNSREIFEFSEEDEASFGVPKIVVVGCGGAGNNTVSCLVRIGLEGARTVAINTDRQHLKIVEADKKILMGGKLTGGAAFIFSGEGSVRKGPEKIVRSALKNPMLEVDCRGAKACLLHMTGGPDLTLKEAAAIAGALTQELDPKANVIWGARIRPDFEGRVRLVAIITGVKSAQVLGPSEPGPKETPARIEVIK